MESPLIKMQIPSGINQSLPTCPHPSICTFDSPAQLIWEPLGWVWGERSGVHTKCMLRMIYKDRDNTVRKKRGHGLTIQSCTLSLTSCGDLTKWPSQNFLFQNFCFYFIWYSASGYMGHRGSACDAHPVRASPGGATCTGEAYSQGTAAPPPPLCLPLLSPPTLSPGLQGRI